MHNAVFQQALRSQLISQAEEVVVLAAEVLLAFRIYPFLFTKRLGTTLLQLEKEATKQCKHVYKYMAQTTMKLYFASALRISRST